MPTAQWHQCSRLNVRIRPIHFGCRWMRFVGSLDLQGIYIADALWNPKRRIIEFKLKINGEPITQIELLNCDILIKTLEFPIIKLDSFTIWNSHPFTFECNYLILRTCLLIADVSMEFPLVAIWWRSVYDGCVWIKTEEHWMYPQETSWKKTEAQK